MLFSVIIASYNTADELRITLASCEEQTLDRSQWEIIIVDADSTDSTVAVTREYDHLIDKFVSEPDHGIYDAMNKGANLARGTYLQFLNCGDTLSEAHTLAYLAETVKATASAPLWIVTAAKHMHGAERPATTVAHFPHRWWDHLLGRQPHIHQAIFFRTDIFLLLGGYDKQIDVVADYDLIVRLGILEPPHEVHKITVIYAGGGISQRRRASIPGLLHKVRAKRLSLPAGPRALSLIYARQKSLRENLQLRRKLAALHKVVFYLRGSRS